MWNRVRRAGGAGSPPAFIECHKQVPNISVQLDMRRGGMGDGPGTQRACVVSRVRYLLGGEQVVHTNIARAQRRFAHRGRVRMDRLVLLRGGIACSSGLVAA